MGITKYDDVSIFYDKSRNKYTARITLEKGKPRKNIRGNTEEEVLLKARQLLYGARDETYIVSKGMPLIELVKYNFERKVNAGKVGDAQFNRTLYIIKQIEDSKIGNINVQKLTENDLQDFFNSLAKRYANSSIDKCYTEINQSLKYALRKKMIPLNVLEDIIKPTSEIPEKEILTFTIEEQKILSDYLQEQTIKSFPNKNVLLIQLYMGLRIGEALTLKSTDIDLKNRKIHIQRSLTENREGKRVIGETTKTYSGDRVIPIPDIVYSYVKEQVEISKNNIENLLFTSNNKTISHTSINGQLQRRLINLGIFKKGMSTHSLRHTYATRCIEGGMPAIVLSKLLGHSDIRITLNTYVKVFNEFQAKASREIEKYYKELEFSITPQEEPLEITGKIIQFPKTYKNDYYADER